MKPSLPLLASLPLLVVSLFTLVDASYRFELVGHGMCLNAKGKLPKRYGGYLSTLQQCKDKCNSVEGVITKCLGVAYSPKLSGGNGLPPGYCSIYSNTRPDKMQGPFDDGKLELASGDGNEKWECYKAVPEESKDEDGAHDNEGFQEL